MALTIAAEPIPLAPDADGVVRVGGTRVTFDSVVFAFNQSGSAEEVVHRYPSLKLADVYAVITYDLRHRDEVDAYLAERRREAERAQAENEARWPSFGIRERLIERRNDVRRQA